MASPASPRRPARARRTPSTRTVRTRAALGEFTLQRRVQFHETDKAGIVQCRIGRASFTQDALKANLVALIDALNKSRPAGAKGVYLRKLAVSSTMGPGVRIDLTSLTSQ